jgi:hypothetical protein
MSTYTVELRIEGESLSPEELTEALGLEPTLVRHAGDPRGRSSVFTKALWAYSGNAVEQEWASLEEGLNGLLSLLSGKEPILKRYAGTATIYWWCGHFQSTFDHDTVMSPALLGRLADLNFPLHLVSYFSDDSRGRSNSKRVSKDRFPASGSRKRKTATGR